MLPVDQIFRSRMAPVHVTPVPPVGVVLEKEMILAVVVGEAVGVVGPAAARRKLELRPAQLFDELLDEVKEFSVSNEFDDDVCLLAMEIVRTGNIRGTPP